MPVVLETERLLLRELLLNDLEPLAALFGNPEVMRYVDVDEPLGSDRAREFVLTQQSSYRERGYGLWAVVHRDTATFIGLIGLRQKELEGADEVELGFLLDEATWRQGLAKEGARAVCEHAFRQLGVNRLIVVAHRKNKAAQKTAENIGMQREREIPKVGVVYSLEAPGGES